MIIREITDTSYAKLVALSQFLIGRADDTDAESTISIDAFVNIAQDMGINLSRNQLRDVVTKPPLNNVIVNVTDREVIFKGASGESQPEDDTMSVDQAQDTVEKMAKRALKT